MSQRIIALLTDFGNKDWFVPAMKSVIYHIHPDARLIDVSHEIEPQQTREAGFVLWNAARSFPAPAIFVVVVDPGVGSDRPIVLAMTEKHWFLAPDNGILDLVLSEFPAFKSIMVKNVKFFLEEVSQTFHGRDIFAPVAAFLAKGEDPVNFGSPYTLVKQPSPFLQIGSSGTFHGKVLYIDRFGNLITNFLIHPSLKDIELTIGRFKIQKLSSYFSDVADGEMLAYRGSSGLLEIALRNQHAARVLNFDYLQSVQVFVN
jgi:S-adenosylmethionine hydrolase